MSFLSRKLFAKQAGPSEKEMGKGMARGGMVDEMTKQNGDTFSSLVRNIGHNTLMRFSSFSNFCLRHQALVKQVFSIFIFFLLFKTQLKQHIYNY